jgi:predicted enzyme related to lactoylglutathione lyase
MNSAQGNPIVHIELRTDNLARACAFYTGLFSWRVETVRGETGSYLALEPAFGIEAGVVEAEVERPSWLPYVEVEDVARSTSRAELLGATVVLEPSEGPAGWRSILAVPTGAEIALWQPKA